MNRRAMLAVSVASVVAGCGLSQRPYAERRTWPLLVRRPEILPPRTGGPVLLVRTLRAGPGMEVRGLQSIRPDGSIRVEFYEEWAVPPAEAAEDALRRWLAACGRFAAVLAPGSRLPADQVLEGELDALWTEPEQKDAYASVGITVLEQAAAVPKVLAQQTFPARAPLGGGDPKAAVAAMCAALAQAFADIEARLAG